MMDGYGKSEVEEALPIILGMKKAKGLLDRVFGIKEEDLPVLDAEDLLLLAAHAEEEPAEKEEAMWAEYRCPQHGCGEPAQVWLRTLLRNGGHRDAWFCWRHFKEYVGEYWAVHGVRPLSVDVRGIGDVTITPQTLTVLDGPMSARE